MDDSKDKMVRDMVEALKDADRVAAKRTDASVIPLSESDRIQSFSACDSQSGSSNTEEHSYDKTNTRHHVIKRYISYQLYGFASFLIACILGLVLAWMLYVSDVVNFPKIISIIIEFVPDFLPSDAPYLQ